ncbi:MAG TPA: glycosyltransferase family 39 protein [Rhizomicrobium sp.]|nr:glycosyltransferase family 39 protein [Rhizomicrobium sp.]
MRQSVGLAVGLAVALVAALIALRVVAGAVLPLSADEAYYWLWSKHLAFGYYDHPPMIAWLIRAGTLVFGDTAFGVRVVPLLLSVASSWFVWRVGGERACLLFNLMLMIAVETMAATPDAPLIAASCAFLFCLTKVDEDPRWWLAVGAAGGLALLSKYTAFFLGAGALFWIVLWARRWLVSPWPYLGAALALLIFAPNTWWNATHHWETFAFQFGRVGAGHFTLRFLFELLGAQLLLASPFILLAGVQTRDRLLIGLMLPAVAYFAIHSLHDRVQGNWPCFLYPMLAVAAAQVRMRPAVPVAAVMLAACYAQVFFGVLPLGRKDPGSRLLGYGMAEVARQLEAAHPKAILTTDYETTSWLSFYGHLPVVQVNEPERGLGGPLPAGPLLYVAERDRHELFARAAPWPAVVRSRAGVPVARYAVYVVNP